MIYQRRKFYVPNVIVSGNKTSCIASTNNMLSVVGIGYEEFVDVPDYTEVQYTTPGTYTFTVPSGITKIRVAVCAGGGGGDVFPNYFYIIAASPSNAGDGGTSSAGSISATGGGGGKYHFDGVGGDDYTMQEYSAVAGTAGSPNGAAGSTVNYSSTTANTTLAGATGHALGFGDSSTSGDYGSGGSGTILSSAGSIGHSIATGGSGGYNEGYITVNSGDTINIVVGSGGTSNVTKYNGTSYGTANAGTDGYVLIAYGGDVENG